MDSNKMMPIPIDDLLQQNIVTNSLYVKLSETKYVMFAKAGTNLSTEHLNKLRARGVNQVYVRAEEYNSVISSSMILAFQVARRPDGALIPKIGILRTLSEQILNQISKLGATRETIAQVKSHCDNIQAVARAHTSLRELVQIRHGKTGSVADHAMEVTLLSLWLANAHEWTNQLVLERLTLGAFMHDLGKVDFPEELLKKPKDLYTREEAELYRSHPERGRAILTAQDLLPEEVAMIVYQHHETSAGTGFPQGLKDAAIHPLARVVALANTFCELVFPSQDESPRKTPQEALSYMEVVLGNPFNKTAMQALRMIVETDSVRKSA